MTDKEIIKALECCYEAELNEDCKKLKCPFFDNEIYNCMNVDNENAMYRYCLDLINRQQAEIERLTINMNAFGLGMKQEKERADTIKAEAIKEFADRLKDYFREKAIETFGDMADSVEYLTIDTEQTEIDIDNLVKEMTEPSLLDKKLGGEQQ